MDAELDPEEIRDGLEAAGLTAYQADAYITLLQRGVSPAVDVAKNCSVPVPRIYDVLKDLEQAGYIETFEQDTLHARAHDPVEVIDQLHNRSELLSDTASAIENAWEESSLAEHKMSVVKHADTVIDQAAALIRDAESTIELGVTREQLDELEPALAEATAGGAITRVSLYVTGEEPSVDELPEAPSEIRLRRIPGPFLTIVDRTHTCFAPNDRSDRPYGVILNDGILSFIFHWYFQTCLWSIWPAVHERGGRHFSYVSLKEFIREIYPFWWNGARIAVTVSGRDPDTGEPRRATGVVGDLAYTGMDLRTRTPPTYGQLAGQSTVWLDTGDGTVLVGGWGAVFEDIEAQRITTDAIVVDSADIDDIAATYFENDLGAAFGRLAPQVTTS